jgi:hypothetical protein
MDSEQMILIRCIAAVEPRTLGDAIAMAVEHASDPELCKALLQEYLTIKSTQGRPLSEFAHGFAVALRMEEITRPTSSIRECERLWALEGGK